MSAPTTGPAAPVLRAAGVRFALAGRAVLDGVDLELRMGEVVGVAGASGSGKTTLLRVLAGLLRPDAGEVRWSGSDRAPRDGSLAMVFQDAPGSLDPRRPLWHTVAEPVTGDRRVRRARAEQALAAVGLGALDPARRPGTLSGGQCQRVALARVLVAPPAVLLADEPTSALDVSVAAGVLGLLRVLARVGTAIVLVSHDPAVLGVLADRELVLARGRLSAPPS